MISSAGSTSRMQAWNGLDLVPEQYGTFPRVASVTEHTSISVEDGLKKPPRRRQTRLLCKDGAYTLISRNIPNLTSRFISDFWNTLLDMPWMVILCFFLFSSVGLWVLFGGLFWVISYLHGDFEHENVGSAQWSPCIFFENNSTSFASAFLFSVETLRTIGYGTPRYPTEECAGTVIFLLLGIIVSCLLESILVGLLLAKTHVPQQRTQTLLFSHNATICTRDKQMCLLFRVANIRTSLLLRLALKAFLVYGKQTDEGEDMPFHQHELDVQIDCTGEYMNLGTPVTACHVIDGSSPFYHLSRKNLSRAAFEIIVILEGVVESTGPQTSGYSLRTGLDRRVENRAKNAEILHTNCAPLVVFPTDHSRESLFTIEVRTSILVPKKVRLSQFRWVSPKLQKSRIRGSSVQARTSYIPDEILWGERFESMYNFESYAGSEIFDFTSFNATEPQVGMKDLSSYELQNLVQLTSPISAAATPTILLSIAEDHPDSADVDEIQEAIVSPSLAKALDIPYQVIQNRNRAASRRLSAFSTHRLSRIDSSSVHGLNLGHPCHPGGDEQNFGEMRLRRASMSRAGSRKTGSTERLPTRGPRKLSSPY